MEAVNFSNISQIAIFKSSNIVFSNAILPAILIVLNGKINRIHHYQNETHAEQILNNYNNETVYDFGSSVIMPGVIDTHVHVNEPGRTDWEGYETATRAAAAGGVTTIVDMPLNSIPPTTTLENLKVKVKATRGKTSVDVGFWGGVIPGNQKHLKDLVHAGVVGFKCFMCPSGVDEFPYVNETDITLALQELHSLNSLLAFHAEMETEEAGSKPSGNTSLYSTFLNTRPPSMEVKALQVATTHCKTYNTRCHIVHLSAAEGLEIIKHAKNNGVNLTVETCHHYLNIAAEDVPNGATQYKCTPPIRQKSNQNKLWTALKNGDLDMVVSDHSPCTENLKTPGNFMTAWGGIASMQFDLSLMWTGARQRNFSLIEVSKLLSANPAKVVGFDKFKGTIKEGMDADFVIWNPEEKFTVQRSNIYHKNKLTPYEGRTLYGLVIATVVRGQFVYNKGNFSHEPKGQLLLNKQFLEQIK
ncbi:allantoinase [Leptopilina boulardi]|uniref:allantoinase n=1 Tax=Leptopilina boulardi TaxID=63433 RepID=UPI0021F54122|nr:allantoinase [Leptopilina boulardi]